MNEVRRCEEMDRKLSKCLPADWCDKFIVVSVAFLQ